MGKPKKAKLEVEYEISQGDDGRLWFLTFICKEKIDEKEFQAILYKLIVEEDFEEIGSTDVQ